MRRWRSDVTAAVVSITTLVVVVALVIGYSGGLGSRKVASAILPSGQAQHPEPSGDVRTFTLTAGPATLQLKAGLHHVLGDSGHAVLAPA
jgi:hypothetical protein